MDKIVEETKAIHRKHYFSKTNGEWNCLTFPMQNWNDTTIPLIVAQEGYKEYAAQQGTGQSLERLGERGGFAGSELCILLFERIKRLEMRMAHIEELKGFLENKQRVIDEWAKYKTGFCAHEFPNCGSDRMNTRCQYHGICETLDAKTRGKINVSFCGACTGNHENLEIKNSKYKGTCWEYKVVCPVTGKEIWVF